MPSPLTLRLDDRTRRRIARIAKRQNVSTSEVVRRAIVAWTERQEAAASPYHAIEDLLGIVRGGDPSRSSRTGRKLSALLKKRRSTA